MILGRDTLDVYFLDDDGPPPPELDYLTRARLPRQRDSDAYMFLNDDDSGWNGFDLDLWSTLPDAEIVARIAASAQELIMERSAYFGQSFPPCPDHVEPLWAEVVEGEAVWRCTNGGNTVVPIGQWPGPPSSFHESVIDDWCEWVLDNGLPATPEKLGRDEAVPVARWAGERWGAVMYLEWWEADEDDPDDEDFISTEVQPYRRTASGWEPAAGSGGSNWPSSGTRIARVEVPDRAAHLGGETGNVSYDGSWYCVALEGFVGRDAATVTVVDESGEESTRSITAWGSCSRRSMARVQPSWSFLTLRETSLAGTRLPDTTGRNSRERLRSCRCR
jgi:hypothetical protein